MKLSQRTGCRVLIVVSVLLKMIDTGNKYMISEMRQLKICFQDDEDYQSERGDLNRRKKSRSKVMLNMILT